MNGALGVQHLIKQGDTVRKEQNRFIFTLFLEEEELKLTE